MHLDPAVLAAFTISFEAAKWLRSTGWAFRATPLGMGYGHTRFASPTNGFQLLYIAEDMPTSLAEAIVRDRFEGITPREMMRSEFDDWGICEVSTTAPLRLLDLRGDACFELGLSTDIAGGKAQDEARAFSQALYDGTDLDGIIYRSRLRKLQDCVAVYDRAVSMLTSSAVEPLQSQVDFIPAVKALRIDLIA